jgi:hypothetical protein
MYMNISIIQISSRYHLKITKWFHTKEDNSRIVPKNSPNSVMEPRGINVTYFVWLILDIGAEPKIVLFLQSPPIYALHKIYTFDSMHIIDNHLKSMIC